MNNMYKLGLAWQLTGNTAYPERAWTELISRRCLRRLVPGQPRVSSSPRKRPTASPSAMTGCTPTGPRPRRDTIRTALINKGLNAGLSSYKANFWALRRQLHVRQLVGRLQQRPRHRSTRRRHRKRNPLRRHPQPGDEFPALEFETLHHRPRRHPRRLHLLEYAQQYAVRGLAGLEWTLGSDFGLSTTQAFSETAFVPIFTGGPNRSLILRQR